MMKHLIISMSVFALCNTTYANVTVLDNTELASVVVQTQQEELQPVLPEYDSNGQIGGVTRALSVSKQPIAASLGAPATIPSANTGLNGGIALQLPVSPLTDLILNLPSRNISIPQNIGR